MRNKIKRLGSGDIVLDLHHDIDHSVISRRVWDTVERAVHTHRKLGFNYLSPRYADGNPVYHEVAPYQLAFHEGHWYLRAYNLRVDRPIENTANPSRSIGKLARFRLSYICDDERLRVFPSVVATHFCRPPRFEVHYLLKPEIGRGEISHRFPETLINRLPDGSAEVRAVTDDVWEAARILLTLWGRLHCVRGR